MRRCPMPGAAEKAPIDVRRPSLSSAGYPSGIGGNHDVETRVRLAQRLLDLLRRLGLGEHEAEVAVALRQRDERAADRDRDLEPGDVRGSSRLLLTLDPLEISIPDRKSTRLNSSHPSISYAVFCLKKKKQYNNNTQY